MAISTAAYSPKEFQVLIAEQDAFGTIEAGGGNPYHAIDVDSIGSPSLNPSQALDVRAGSRVLQATDFFQDSIASVKDISISGTATTHVLDMLLENIMGEAEDSASGVYSFLSSADTQSVGTAASSQAGTLLSVVIKSAFETNADLSFKDCVVTNLTLNGDTGTEGGRIKFSATLQTGSVVEDLTDAVTTVDTTFAASESYLMSSWVAAQRKIYGVDELVMSSFSLTLDNPATFAGLLSTGYEVIARAGEFSATLDSTVKYDAETEDFFEKFNNQTNHSSTAAQATLLNHQASLANGSFGINIPLSVLTNVAFNEGDIMMLDLSVKAVGSGPTSSTALVEVAC
tara:strand:+ start:514 stop:1542 length:1029 start_codon:yes stop_codon:yes gene_type:complete